MSWDSYMGTLSEYTGGTMYFGAICGFDGSVWASKGDVSIAQTEALTLINICNSVKADVDNSACNGVLVAGEKYKYLRQDPEEKSVKFMRTSDKKDMYYPGSAMLTNQVIVICITKETDSGSKRAATSAYNMAEYLKSQSF